MDSSTADFLKQTELRLGLPGTYSPKKKRGVMDEFLSLPSSEEEEESNRARMVGWPPIRRSYRKMTNTMSNRRLLFVKVSMDGVPYLRNVDLNTYCNYRNLSSELQKMFSRFINRKSSDNNNNNNNNAVCRRRIDGVGVLGISDYVVTYEDKDGDWMLVGDVPWE